MAFKVAGRFENPRIELLTRRRVEEVVSCFESLAKLVGGRFENPIIALIIERRV